MTTLKNSQLYLSSTLDTNTYIIHKTTYNRLHIGSYYIFTQEILYIYIYRSLTCYPKCPLRHIKALNIYHNILLGHLKCAKINLITIISVVIFIHSYHGSTFQTQILYKQQHSPQINTYNTQLRSSNNDPQYQPHTANPKASTHSFHISHILVWYNWANTQRFLTIPTRFLLVI